MAVCLTCHQPMGQTEAICSRCGEDYLGRAPDGWAELLLHQSSLRDVFRLTSVVGLFLAFTPSLYDQFRTSAFWPLCLGILCGVCVLLLGDSAPTCSRVVSLMGILAFLWYPIIGLGVALIGLSAVLFP